MAKICSWRWLRPKALARQEGMARSSLKANGRVTSEHLKNWWQVPALLLYNAHLILIIWKYEMWTQGKESYSLFLIDGVLFNFRIQWHFLKNWGHAKCKNLHAKIFLILFARFELQSPQKMIVPSEHSTFEVAGLGNSLPLVNMQICFPKMIA